MGICMDIFNDTSSLECRCFVRVLLDGLLRFESVGLEMSGVFLGCDEDLGNVPDYLESGGLEMSFEYMESYVICSMLEGAKYIEWWCEENVVIEREVVMNDCKRLVSLYSDFERGRRAYKG